jgi:hypothetical protein
MKNNIYEKENEEFFGIFHFRIGSFQFIYLFIYLTDMCWSHHSTTGIASCESVLIPEEPISQKWNFKIK